MPYVKLFLTHSWARVPIYLHLWYHYYNCVINFQFSHRSGVGGPWYCILEMLECVDVILYQRGLYLPPAIAKHSRPLLTQQSTAKHVIGKARFLRRCRSSRSGYRDCHFQYMQVIFILVRQYIYTDPPLGTLLASLVYPSVEEMCEMLIITKMYLLYFASPCCMHILYRAWISQ